MAGGTRVFRSYDRDHVGYTVRAPRFPDSLFANRTRAVSESGLKISEITYNCITHNTIV